MTVLSVTIKFDDELRSQADLYEEFLATLPKIARSYGINLGGLKINDSGEPIRVIIDSKGNENLSEDAIRKLYNVVMKAATIVEKNNAGTKRFKPFNFRISRTSDEKDTLFTVDMKYRSVA